MAQDYRGFDLCELVYHAADTLERVQSAIDALQAAPDLLRDKYSNAATRKVAGANLLAYQILTGHTVPPTVRDA